MDQIALVSVEVELVANQAVLKKKKIVPVAEKTIVVQKKAVSRQIQEIKQQEMASIEQEVRPETITEPEAQLDYFEEQKNQQHHEAGDRANELQKYVYEAINRQKHYPYIARKQRREGVVKLNFIMHPDGQVTDVAIVQSSRFSILDKAAQKAVEAISPFHLAADYLEVEHQYNVDIAFRLN